MDRVEHGVTTQLEKTLERLAAINNQQQEQQRVVESIQGDQCAMNARLQMLEQKVQVIQSTTLTSGGANRLSSWAAGGTIPPQKRHSTKLAKWSRTSALTLTRNRLSC